MLTEEEVYNGTKRWLTQNGFMVIAGQPAKGVDHLPVIEIKLTSKKRGSKYAYKPDLVAYKSGKFYIIECKPRFNKGDLEKVNQVLSSTERLVKFYNELKQYNLLKRVGCDYSSETFCEAVEGMLAYSGKWGPECSLHQLLVFDWKGNAILK